MLNSSCINQSTAFFNYFSNLFKKLLHNLLYAQLMVAALNAQNDVIHSRSWQIKPVVNLGFIMVHRATIGHLVKGYPGIYELNVSKPTQGNKLWHLENNKPDIGFTFQCIDFKNHEQLGFAYVAAPYIEIPLTEKTRVSRVIMRLAWGFTYITRPFDMADNHKNIAIGSHANAFVQFRWFWHLQLNNYLRFEPGITFSHASNGKSKNPNLGLNVLSIGAGLNYLIPAKEKQKVMLIDSGTKARSRNELLVYTSMGVNKRDINTPLLKCYLFSVAYQRNVRNTHKFSAGIDFYYDQSYQVDYENVFNKKAVSINQFRLSAKAGYSYNVGRISFPIELGYYIFQRANPDAAIVSRIGVRYYSPWGVVVNYGLRTHYAVAYNFEYGLGYRFFL